MKDAADAAELIVKGELLEAQSRFNKKPKKEKKPKEQKEENKEMAEGETTPQSEEA